MDCRHRKKLPTIWLITDERMGDAALLDAVARLPKGKAGIVFRHYHTPKAKRRALFEQVARIARRRRLMVMLADSARQAMAWGADGWHGRDGGGARWRLFHSASAHDAREMHAALGGGADLLFLSPLFPTRSHPGGRALGLVRFAALARQAGGRPVMALGGMQAAHRWMLRGIGAAGWAAIDGLSYR